MTAQQAIDYAEETVRIIDEDIHEDALTKAQEFFEDIREKSLSVAETIKRYDRVSPKQEKALRGWREGVERWVHED